MSRRKSNPPGVRLWQAGSLRWMSRGLWLAATAILLFGPRPLTGQDPTPIGAFLRVRSPIRDANMSHIERAARQVLGEATRAGQRPIIVFEIEPGPSEYHHCLGLARFIANELRGATTVAYLAKPTYGHTVMVALACDEIVMAPDAAIGDIGRGEDFIAQGQRRDYIDLVERRRQVPEALVLGMLDKGLEVLEAETQAGRRFVLRQDLEKLRGEVAVGDTRVVKDASAPGIFSAREARNYGIAARLAPTREAVADAYGLPNEALIEDPTLGAEPKAVLLRFDGFINSVQQQFVFNSIDAALVEGVNLVIVEIDSPGGEAQISIDIANYLRKMERARTVAYIPRQALSGAAFVALGCDEILMHADARMGDAGPIIIGPDAVFRHAPEKLISDLSPQVRLLAESKHRPPALAEAMVNRNVEVFEVRNKQTGKRTFMSDAEIADADDPGEWEKGKLVFESRQDHFLEVTGSRAVELGLAADTVESFAAVKQRYGLDIDPRVLNRTWVDGLVYYLNTGFAKGTLLVVGLICLYIEINTPGFGLGGLVAGLCFLLFFWSSMLGGTATWLEVLLFLAGVGCLALEIFVIPGFGVTGVTGALLILGSIVLASQTFIIPRTSYEYEVFGDSLKMLSLSLAAFTGLAFALGRYFHAIPVFSRMVLAPPTADEIIESDAELAQTGGGADWLFDQKGVTTTTLRPAGKARFGDHFVDVVAEGGFIAQGSQVRVIEVSGNRVVVKEV